MSFDSMCNCCCDNSCTVYDQFPSLDPSWLMNGDTYTVYPTSSTEGYLRLAYGDTGSCYQSVSISPERVGRKIDVTANVYEMEPQPEFESENQMAGIFIGKGVCFYCKFGLSFALWMKFAIRVGCDEFGNGGTETELTDWFQILAYPTMTLRMEDWLGDGNYTCSVTASRSDGIPGTLISKFFTYTTTLDDNTNVGLWSAGGGQFKSFCAIVNNNAVLACCSCCLFGVGCTDDATYPIAYTLSVPSVGDPLECADVKTIEGDYYLKWYPQGCNYASAEEAQICSMFAPYNIWELRTEGSFVRLRSGAYYYESNAQNWNCTTAMTLNRNTFLDQFGPLPSTAPPATLTVIPIYRS